MRVWHITYYGNQIIKVRATLEDNHSPVADIKKPRNMRTAKYVRLISRLERLEQTVQKLIREGGESFIDRRYRA